MLSLPSQSVAVKLCARCLPVGWISGDRLSLAIELLQDRVVVFQAHDRHDVTWSGELDRAVEAGSLVGGQLGIAVGRGEVGLAHDARHLSRLPTAEVMGQVFYDGSIGFIG